MKKRCMALFMALTVFASQISGSALTAFAEDTGVQTEIAAAEASTETTAEEVSAEEQEILTKATVEPQEQEAASAEAASVGAVDAQAPAEEQASAAAEDTKIPAEAQESAASEGTQIPAEEQVSATTADAQTAEAAPAEDYVEEEAIVGDAEELPQEESAEDADAQDTTDGENAPFDTAAINLADSQISVETASIEADPMLTEEDDNGNEEPVGWSFWTESVNNAYEVFPNGELTLTVFASHRLGKDEEGDETFEDLSDAHIEWSIKHIPDEDQEGEETVVSPVIEPKEDTSEWNEAEKTLSSKRTIKTENATEGEYEITLTVKRTSGDDETFSIRILVTSKYCNLKWEIEEGNNKSLLPNLEPGKSITVSPKWMFYSSDEKEPQQITEGVWYKWIFDRDYDCEKCEDFPLAVQAKKDGKDVDPAQATNEYGWYNAEAVDAFEIAKLHDCWAAATLVVIGEMEGASGDPEVEIPEGYVWMDDLYQSFDSMGYDIWSEENSVDIYTGGEGTIAISGDRAYGSSGCASDAEIVWSAEGVDAENANNIISALPKELTYNAEIDDNDNDNVGSGSVSADAVSALGVKHLKLRADLVIDGYEEPLDTETIAVHVIPSSVRFDNIPNEKCSRLLGDVISIGTTEWAWVEDQKHPESDYVNFTVQNVSVEPENDVLRCTQRTPEEDEAGEPWWDIECRKPGTGKVTVKYCPLDGDDTDFETLTFTVEVSGRTYDMEVLSESSTDQMLSGTTMRYSTKLTETVLDIENKYENDVLNYTLGDLVCTRFNGPVTSSEEFVQVETDGTDIVVTAEKGMWGWAEFQVSAYVPESDKPVATTNFTVNVQDSYLVLTANLEKEQIGLGETLALASKSTGGESVTIVKPQVMCYWIDEEGNERGPEPYEDVVTYYWEFDGAAWESDDENANAQSITRTGADRTSVDLVAEAENGWRSNLHYDFDPIWYDEFGFEEDHYDWFYDENAKTFDLTLTGIPQDLPEDCSMEMSYDLKDGDVDYVTVTKQESGKVTLSLNKGITLNDLKKGYVYVEAYLDCGGTRVGEAGVDVAIRNASDYPWYEFSFNDYEYKIGESLDLMKDEAEGGYPAWVTVYDRDTPDGKPLKVIITGVVPGSYNDEVVEVKEEDGILRFVLKGMSSNEKDEDPGCTGVYVTFKNADGYEYDWPENSLYFQLWCRDEVCDLKVRAGEQEIREDNVVQMLLDDELQLSAELAHQIYDPETQQFVDQETEYELLYKSSDSEIIEVAEDGLVTAKEAGDATLFLFAVDKGFSAEISGALDKAWYEEEYTELDNLDEHIICAEEYPITVQASYYSLDVADNPIYMESGKAVMVTPTLTVRSILESMDGTAAKGTFTYRCEADPNYFITSVEENTITITAGQLRLDKEDLEVTIIAYNERGDEVARCILPVIICKQHDMQETVKKAATCVAAGEAELVCSKCGYTETEEIPATGHTPGDWTTVSPATTEAPEKQQRTCTVCGTVIEERTVGEKLQPSTEAPSTPSTEAPSTPSTEATGTDSAQTPGTESAGAGSGTGAVQEPFIELNATSIPMKLKQSTKVIKVKMAEGDSVVSWESSNKKVVTVTKKGKIKAKKKGKATITVTLASGKTASFVVKVQKNKVTTKKVTGVTKKLTLAKGKKYKLTPVLKPLTSQDKITYTSSNKKVATVDKKGNIQAKGKGTAKITVKSGKKKAVCTVTVK